MNEKIIFVELMYDLRRRADGGFYDHIKGCGLVRQLLMDGGNSLAHRINREYKLKLQFPVERHEYEPGLVFAMTALLTNADPAKNDLLSLDQFLAHTCSVSGPQKFSVKEFVEVCANVMGGVHSGSSKTEREQFIESNLYHDEAPYSVGAGFFVVKSILKMTVTALLELEHYAWEDVKRHRTALAAVFQDMYSNPVGNSDSSPNT